MNNILKKVGKSFSDFVYKNFEKDSGNMLLITGITGIILSTAAQTAAIMFNKKYSVSQKAFMIPQELTDGTITICSMFFVTKPIQFCAKKYVKSGKILTKDMKNYLRNNNLLQKCGNRNFDIKNSINNIIYNTKKSDEFIKSSKNTQDKILKKHHKMLDTYDSINDATLAIATTAGSMFSTALISPFLRNYSASKYQKVNIQIYDNIKKQKMYNNKTYNYINNTESSMKI